MSNESIKSPLPGYASSVNKIIETAIEKNDLDFFYRLYLTRMAELSLTGQGKEFIEYAKSSLDDSQNSLFMAKGFEAIGNLIELNFSKCIELLDELEFLFCDFDCSESRLWFWLFRNIPDHGGSVGRTQLFLAETARTHPHFSQ